ncbi:putative membrane-bound transcription factor site-2 protease-like [Capsicum annuum]|nr:putative membrane-bound transcription factor site-2 protease-like [Capsicum annuum]
MKGVMCFGKRGKLSPRYVGQYQILKRICTVAYELEFPASLGFVHPVFHVSMLKKCIGDHSMVLTVEGIKVTDSLSYVEEPVEILDRQVRKLRSKEIASVKVLWRNQKVEEATWESENDMKIRYPNLFASMEEETEVDLKGEKSMIGGGGSSESTSDDGQSKSHDRWSDRTVDRSRVFGINEKENFMERFLIRRDNEVKGFKAIGIIYGVAGVGKTTLCQLTFNNEQVMNDFFPRIWVCMSKSPEDVVDYREEVVRRMLKCLGVEDEEMEFTSKHRDNCTEKLALGLPKQQGGAAIVTTRSEELAKEMVGEENVHPLLPLQEKSCREIFEDSAGEKVKQLLKDQTDHDLEDTIMSKLGGLPLAAKIMGKIMEQELDKMPANTTSFD